MTTKLFIIYAVIAVALYLIVKYAYDKGQSDASSTTTVSPTPATQKQRCPDGQCYKTKTVGDITYGGCGPCAAASV